MTIGIWGKSGQSLSKCSKDQQMRQGNGVETSLGEVKGVSSSRYCPLSVILTGSIGDGEGNGVAYAETRLFSSEDKCYNSFSSSFYSLDNSFSSHTYLER